MYVNYIKKMYKPPALLKKYSKILADYTKLKRFI